MINNFVTDKVNSIDKHVTKLINRSKQCVIDLRIKIIKTRFDFVPRNSDNFSFN